MTRWLPLSWAVVLTGLLLGSALAPGYVLVRDMVWVPDLALRSDVLGLGSALPRAVPSDAVVAVLDEIVPGMLVQKLVLVGSLVGAGTGAAALVRGGLVQRLVAVSLAVWSPFVAERLSIGHWPVLLGYAAVPWLAVAGRRVAAAGRIPPWTPLVLVVGSLSASAGLVSAAVLLATALAGGVRRRVTVALVLTVVAANAPWVVAGLANASAAGDAEGYRAFATSGHGLPAPLAVLTLGGIWNADAVPASRGGPAGWAAVVLVVGLAALGARRWWRTERHGQCTALLGLWAAGVGIAVLSWAAPDAVGALGRAVPGLAVLRDGSRSLALALPLTVAVVSSGAALLAGLGTRALARTALAVAVVLAPVAVLPDIAWGLGGSLRPTHLPDEWLAARHVVTGSHGDAALLPWSSYRAPAWNGRRPVLDPLGRLLTVDTVASDDLVVGSTTVRGEDPRVREAASALQATDPEGRAKALRAMGVGWVVVEKDAGSSPEVAGRVLHDGPLLRVVRLEGDVRRPDVAQGRVLAQGAAWAALLAAVLAGVVTSARWIRVRMATRRSETARVPD
ncbi:hypothetical protein SAMN04487968_103128 [Nocardioides terrae]|uniref:Membrane protein YfhO n=1 Tax=Nocardioides terrae TaxID=574651 RepID=A0A1I1FTF4_9ACTN|nr:hypothetical protein [Nocardioides terrae]SFC02839.1 hypothetical protein SAMN04487968_103128 [Nocardioides terrae]